MNFNPGYGDERNINLNITAGMSRLSSRGLLHESGYDNSRPTSGRMGKQSMADVKSMIDKVSAHSKHATKSRGFHLQKNYQSRDSININNGALSKAIEFEKNAKGGRVTAQTFFVVPGNELLSPTNNLVEEILVDKEAIEINKMRT